MICEKLSFFPIKSGRVKRKKDNKKSLPPGGILRQAPKNAVSEYLPQRNFGERFLLSHNSGDLTISGF